MDKSIIGTNAGIVWRTLHEKKANASFRELVEETGLPDCEVAAAIGWLAREDKIWFTTTEDGTQLLSVYQEYYY